MNYAEYRAFAELVEQRKVLFYYHGYFSQNVVSAMADTIKLSLKQSEAAPSTKRKLFSCFVEMAQNIIHYSSETLTPQSQGDKEVRQGSLCIGQAEDRYYLLCANRVAPGDVESLRAKLEPLRTMTLEEIKRAYQDTLRADLAEGSKGAGLGFLTVARDASQPLEFAFESTDDASQPLFYLKAIV
ncbi:MAG TPA: SiaB family protein kinase [Rudaea sp.]|nr:SiaB family protein kinase [Rudaea sp.]